MNSETGTGSFREGYIEADGFRMRYKEAGQGDPLVVLHGGGGLRHYSSHDALALTRRVILLEAPGFGKSDPNERSQNMAELANTIFHAVGKLGITVYDLWGTSFGGKLALWLAVQHPESVRALILVGPAAIRSQAPAAGQQGQFRVYAYPERVPPQEQLSPEDVEKQRTLTRRLIGPARDEELEGRMAALDIPVLVIFGTEDSVLPPEMGRYYKEILPNCNLIFLYDAGHEADADRPEAFTSLVNDFLRRHSAFVVKTESDLIHP